MDELLTALKLLGALIAGVLGIIGILTHTRRPSQADLDAGRPREGLNHWGKIALGLASAGLLVALGALITEQVRERRDALRELRTMNTLLAQDATLLGQNNEVLRQVQRAAYHLPDGDFEVTLKFSLPASEPLVKALIKEVRAAPAENKGGTAERPFWVNSGGTSHRSARFRPVPEEPPRQARTLAECISMLRLECAVERSALPKGGITGVFSPTDRPRDAEFVTPGTRSRAPADFTYYFDTDELIATVGPFSCGRKDWTAAPGFSSILDLGSAHLILGYTVSHGVPDPELQRVVSGLAPTWIHIRWGSAEISLDTLGENVMHGGLHLVAAKLPKESALMNRTAFKRWTPPGEGRP